MRNDTQPKEFVLIGFSTMRPLQNVLLAPRLALYLLMIAGNGTIAVMICLDSRLHTPMYFFLCNFSLVEMLVTSTVVPRMLADLMVETTTISFGGCLVQFYFYFSLGTTAFLLLAVMSIDRYVAICHPLRYSTILSNKVCVRLVSGSWATSFFSMVPPTIFRAMLPFCNSNQIDHFSVTMCPCSNSPVQTPASSSSGISLSLFFLF